MYNWFSDEPTSINRGESIPGLKQSLDLVRANIEDTVRYYRRAPLSVTNTHVLVRLLSSLPISLDRDAISYFYTIKELGLEQAVLLKMTTTVNYGKITSPGMFYGSSTNEIVIAHDTEFDYDGVDNGTIPWRDLQPLKVLSHPFTDLNMGRLNGKYHSVERGSAVLSLNIPMLAAQYRMWYKHERSAGEGPARRTHQFISQYVLTNAVWSHANIALLNRISAMALDDDVMSFKIVHPFFMSDNTVHMDAPIRKLIDALKKRTRTWDEIITALPAFDAADIRPSVALPQTASTRQIHWAFVIARLRLIDFLARFNRLTNNRRNQLYIRRLKGFFDSIKTDRILSDSLPNDVLVEIDRILYRSIMPLLG